MFKLDRLSNQKENLELNILYKFKKYSGRKAQAVRITRQTSNCFLLEADTVLDKGCSAQQV